MLFCTVSYCSLFWALPRITMFILWMTPNKKKAACVHIYQVGAQSLCQAENNTSDVLSLDAVSLQLFCCETVKLCLMLSYQGTKSIYCILQWTFLKGKMFFLSSWIILLGTFSFNSQITPIHCCHLLCNHIKCVSLAGWSSLIAATWWNPSKYWPLFPWREGGEKNKTSEVNQQQFNFSNEE